VRWAAAEGVSETVIAAVLLLHERNVDEIASKLRPDELEQVISSSDDAQVAIRRERLMPLKHGALSGRARAPERSQRPKASLGTLLALTIRGGQRHARLLESSTAPMVGTVPWNAPVVPTPVRQPGSAPRGKKAAPVSGWSTRPLAAA
jgi:hypothetical protein